MRGHAAKAALVVRNVLRVGKGLAVCRHSRRKVAKNESIVLFRLSPFGLLVRQAKGTTLLPSFRNYDVAKGFAEVLHVGSF